MNSAFAVSIEYHNIFSFSMDFGPPCGSIYSWFSLPSLCLYSWYKRFIKLCVPATGSTYASFLYLDSQSRWHQTDYQPPIFKDRKHGFISHKGFMIIYPDPQFLQLGRKRGPRSEQTAVSQSRQSLGEFWLGLVTMNYLVKYLFSSNQACNRNLNNFIHVFMFHLNIYCCFASL